MEVNKIQEELARLIELVDGWAGSHDVPGIERDLVLDKLKKLYEAIRFANFDEGDSRVRRCAAVRRRSCAGVRNKYRPGRFAGGACPRLPAGAGCDARSFG